LGHVTSDVGALHCGPGNAPETDACGLEVGNLDDGGDADAPPEPYDAAIALDSSCYLDRTRWFACLGRVLGRDATVHIVDYFAGRPDGLRPSSGEGLLVATT